MVKNIFVHVTLLLLAGAVLVTDTCILFIGGATFAANRLRSHGVLLLKYLKPAIAVDEVCVTHKQCQCLPSPSSFRWSQEVWLLRHF